MAAMTSRSVLKNLGMSILCTETLDAPADVGCTASPDTTQRTLARVVVLVEPLRATAVLAARATALPGRIRRRVVFAPARPDDSMPQSRHRNQVVEPSVPRMYIGPSQAGHAFGLVRFHAETADRALRPILRPSSDAYARLSRYAVARA